MSPEGWLVWVNRVYFGAAAVAILATAVTVVAGVTQGRINETLSKRKDREFAQFRLASDAKIADLQRQTAEAN